MQYIILADGKGTRWNNYLNVTKQEAMINNERLLDRIVRQVKERTTDKVLISSRNEKHSNPDATRIIPKYDDYFHKKYTYEYLTEETTFLYGDTYYLDSAMDIIINDPCEEINFYGSEKAIIGIKANNYKLLKAVIDDVANTDCSLYHAFDFMDDKRKFISVGDMFYNINNSNDYEELKTKVLSK